MNFSYMGSIQNMTSNISKLISHYATKIQLLIKPFSSLFLLLLLPHIFLFLLFSSISSPAFLLLLFSPFIFFMLTNLIFVRDKIGLRRQSQQIHCFFLTSLEMDTRLGINTSCWGNLARKNSQFAEGDGWTGLGDTADPEQISD